MMNKITVADYKESWVPEQWLTQLLVDENLDGVLLRGRGEARKTYALISADQAVSSPGYVKAYNNVATRLKIETEFHDLLEFVAEQSDLDVIRKDIDSELKKDSSVTKITYNDSEQKRFINTLALTALRQQVSDIHVFTYTNGTAKIVFERHGLLQVWKETTSKEADAMVTAALVSFSNDYKGQGDKKEQISASIPLPLFEEGSDPVARVTLRVVRDMSDTGTHAVMRVNDSETIAKTMDELGIASDAQIMLRNVIAQNSGILIITGPTGSGKTTTMNALYAGVPEDRKIIYAADPVEGQLGRDYVVPYSVDNKSSNRGFPNIIETALRQAPKIIAIAEARNGEVLAKTFEAALTGHFCGTTYHADDVFLALTRMMNDGIPPHILAGGVLKAVASQRLVRLLCPECKVNHDHPSFGVTFKRNKTGCPSCDHLGVVGRKIVIEILMLDAKVGELIMKNDIPAIRRHAVANGFCSMAARAKNLITKGLIDPYDAIECIPGMADEEVYKYPAPDYGVAV